MGTMNARQHRTAREKYGEELRRRRTAAHLTQDALASEVVCSPTLICHFEAGRRLPNPKDAERLDQVLGTDGWFVRWLEDLEHKYADHFVEAAELEQQAVEIKEFGATLVPGLLQTPEYVRAVFKSARINYLDSELDEIVVNRTARASLLDNPSEPALWVVLDESVIRRPVGGPAVMAQQLERLIALTERGRIKLHVLPFAVGAHSLMEGMLSLMSFSDAAPVAYVEGIKTGRLLDSPAEVAWCSTAYALALAEAASKKDSLALVKSVCEDYRHG